MTAVPKPSSAHSELQRGVKRYLEREARKRYIVLTEVNADQLRRNPNVRRFDIWGLRWADPMLIIIGEVKVSRPDFLSDLRSGKWQDGLENCHLFYFIVPYGLITKDDLPEGPGLMEQRKSGVGFKVSHGIRNDGFAPSEGMLLSVIKKLSTYHGG